MPLRFGTSGSVRASSTPKSARCAHVVHTFWPVTTHSSPSRSARVASDARSEPAPGSLNSWHHISSLRTIGGRNRSRCSSVPCANSAGAARLRPSGLSRPRLNGRSSGSTSARGRRRAGRARRTRPATSARRARTPRTPGTRPRTRRACAPRGSRPAPPRAAGVDPRARHVRLDPRAHRVDDASASRVAASTASCAVASRSSALEVGRRASRGTRPAPRGSRRCATTAPARTPRCAGAVERRARALRAAATSSGRARPSGPCASCVARARRPRASSSAAGPRGGSRPTPRLRRRVSCAAEQQQLAGPDLADAARAAATSRRCRA